MIFTKSAVDLVNVYLLENQNIPGLQTWDVLILLLDLEHDPVLGWIMNE